jgi:hypothetical protein
MLTYRLTGTTKAIGVDRDAHAQSRPTHLWVSTAKRDAVGIFAHHGAPEAPRC